MSAVDLAYQIRVGELILSEHVIPRTDMLAFPTLGDPWVDQQWGAQVLLAAAFKLGSWPGIKLFQALLTATALGFTYLSCRSVGAPPRTASLLTMAALVVGAPSLAMRPQLLAVTCFSIAVWAVVSRREAKWRIWLLPFLALLTTNIHGSFPLIVLLALAAALEDRIDRRPEAGRTSAVALVSLSLTFLSPFGAGVWRYVAELSTNDVIRTTIDEWAPSSLARPAGVLLFISLVATIGYLARRGRATPIRYLLVMLGFLLLALLAQRAIVWWALTTPVIVALLMAPEDRDSPTLTEEVPPSGETRLAYALVGVLALTLVAFLPWWRDAQPAAILDHAPVELSDAASSLPPGSRLLVPQPWGSWFEFAVPQHLVFVDARIEITPASVWADYGEVAFSGAGWRAVLDRWSIDAVVADRESWNIIPFLRDDPSWRVASEDGQGILFVRR